MIDKLDSEMEKFIDHRIHSPLDMDILIYFHRNSVTMGNPKEISKCLGKKVKEVAKALHRFESRGIVRNMSTRGAPIYAYSASDSLHAVIERFVKLVASKQGREMVDNKLIASGKL